MTKKFIPIQCKICENYEPEEVICGIEPKLTLTKEACESLNIFSHYLVDYLKKLETKIKGIQQNLAEIMSKGPTITQKQIWSEKLIKALQNEMAKGWGMKREELFGKEENLSPELKAKLRKLG